MEVFTHWQCFHFPPARARPTNRWAQGKRTTPCFPGPFLVSLTGPRLCQLCAGKMYQGVMYALLAAVLFGASTPLAKELLGDMQPITLAGLLYAGSGAGLAMVQLLRVFVIRRAAPAVWPSLREWAWLGAAILF